MSKINVIQGDILSVEADAIVNPANSHLRHGGGLARVIDKAARDYGGVLHIDPRFAEMSKRVIAWLDDNGSAPLIPTGGAHVTSAGMLPFKAVIHAVGPVWGGGTYYEGSLLALAHRSAFDAAFMHGFEHVAVPAISCGIFGFPVQAAAPIAMRAAYMSAISEITFVLFDDKHYHAYLSARALF